MKTNREKRVCLEDLSYINTFSTEQVYEAAELIQRDMSQSTRKLESYLHTIHALPESILKIQYLTDKKLTKLTKGRYMEHLDIMRYSLRKPHAKCRNSFNAWRYATENVEAQLEHQENRITNLDLMIKYGPNLWRTQNAKLDFLVKNFRKELKNIHTEISLINKERMLSHFAAGNDLEHMEVMWNKYMRKNFEINVACEKMRTDISS
jgi:pre-mRNA-splicing factor SPF27